MTPIYDQPDHPRYGPVRRLHIMLMQLFGDRDFAELERRFEQHAGESWPAMLSRLLNRGKHASDAQRYTLRRLLEFTRG